MWSVPLGNMKRHSKVRPITMTSRWTRLYMNYQFMTLILNLTIPNYDRFPWSICTGCGIPARNAYHSGHPVPFPFWDLCIVLKLRPFFQICQDFWNFSLRIPLGAVSILSFCQKSWAWRFWLFLTPRKEMLAMECILNLRTILDWYFVMYIGATAALYFKKCHHNWIALVIW